MTNTEHLEGDRDGGLLAWQWENYAAVHGHRRNLLIHVLTAPVFMAGTVAVVAAPFTSGWLALAGVAAIVFAIAAQGRGHGMEAAPPIPFRGPLDVVARIFAEQWITFPRYVLSGGLSRAFARAR
ncbi:MAG TPA: hypothetical protein VH062_29480 [Polyangiaceae bacterium]|jgi:hypothetical protein|nr:hypothetical protein [Polyangiaceae bacterium]